MKKNVKRVLALLLAVMMLFTSQGVSFAASEYDEWAQAEAEAQAKQMLQDAEAAGKAAVEAASIRADNELKELRRKADEQTAEKTAVLDGEFASEAAALRSKAEQKLEAAAALIVERIVGG